MAEALGVIETDALPRPVVFAWYAAQLFGWDFVRAHLPRSTWYRYLEALRVAGLTVPENEGLSAQQSEGESSGWGALAPGQVFRLAGRRFRVVQAWEPEFYPVGTTGTVDAVMFRQGAWCLVLAPDGSPGGWEELSIADFLACTAPLEGGDHG